jgi:hypothetical protein
MYQGIGPTDGLDSKGRKRRGDDMIKLVSALTRYRLRIARARAGLICIEKQMQALVEHHGYGNWDDATEEQRHSYAEYPDKANVQLAGAMRNIAGLLVVALDSLPFVNRPPGDS